MKVGMVGLGTMGSAVARNILRAGFSLTVYDLVREKAASLESAGGTWADSPAAVVAESDVIVTMVFGPRELEQVMRGKNGMLSGGMKGRGWIDMTTGSPSLTRELSSEVEKEGGWSLDAPVTGSVDAAIRGDMIMFIGGDSGALSLATPILKAVGEPRPVGDIGCGQVAKLTNNLIWKINAAAIGEAMIAAQKAGLDVRTWWDVMQGGAADTFVLRHDVPSIFAGHYDPSFPLSLCLKDWGLINELLEDVGVRREVANAAHSRFIEAAERYGESAGEMSVCRLLEEDAGASLRVKGEWMPPWLEKHSTERASEEGKR